ncbi:MAG: hypothetical protein K1060chlam5_01146 [Candidatus Anoxychlamydiales bacterium]|nr:hypothetical protein [Candidatus Anoxychlamydiales bacterium]
MASPVNVRFPPQSPIVYQSKSPFLDLEEYEKYQKEIICLSPTKELQNQGSLNLILDLINKYLDESESNTALASFNIFRLINESFGILGLLENEIQRLEYAKQLISIIIENKKIQFDFDVTFHLIDKFIFDDFIKIIYVNKLIELIMCNQPGHVSSRNYNFMINRIFEICKKYGPIIKNNFLLLFFDSALKVCDLQRAQRCVDQMVFLPNDETCIKSCLELINRYVEKNQIKQARVVLNRSKEALEVFNGSAKELYRSKISNLDLNLTYQETHSVDQRGFRRLRVRFEQLTIRV